MSIQHLGLYTRFFLLFTVTTLLLVVFILLGSIALSEEQARQIVLERHSQLSEIMMDVASPPVDIENLRSEASNNRVQIQISDGEQTWQTSESLPHQDELLTTAEKLGSLYFARHGSKYYLLAENDGTWIIVTSQIANLLIYPGWLVYWPWFVVLLVIIISYRLLISQLKPIKLAVYSAKQISQGNFDYRITDHPKNDLAELTHGLNKMAGELKKLFTAKDDLLLAVSHELRSPMARMKVSFALLEKNETVQKLDEDVKQMDLIIDQLLESERLQHPEKALHIDTYFLPQFISEVIDEHKSHERVAVIGDVPEIAVSMDGGRIKFVLRNLIKNALTHSDGNVSILIEPDAHGSLVSISVKDQGSGIQEEYLADLFEPFTTSDSIDERSTKGLGLGLYLCKRIAIAHGGGLTVQSQPGEGSTFTLILPYCS